MVTHIVIFIWRAATTAPQVERMARALDELAAAMSGRAVIKHGADLRFREGNGDYAIAATFADRAGWDAYQADPLHKAFVQEHIAPIQAERLTIQF